MHIGPSPNIVDDIDILRYPMKNHLVWGCKALSSKASNSMYVLKSVLELFTFRLLTQRTQGVFLQSASIRYPFDIFLLKNEINAERKLVAIFPSTLKIVQPK